MAVFVRRPLLSLGMLSYGAPETVDADAVQIGRETRYPGVKVVAGLWRPTVYSPAQAEVIQIEFHKPSNSYVILLDDLAHQHRVAGVHVPYVREGDRLLAGDPLGHCLGFMPKVSLQESAGRHWTPGSVRFPRTVGVQDCLWDSKHEGRVRKFREATREHGNPSL